MAGEQRSQEFHFDLSGGHLALDFANTISRRDSPEHTVEHLNSYRDLVSFARQAGILSPQQAGILTHVAQAHPRNAAQVLKSAIVLREVLFRSFLSLAHGKSASSQDIGRIERALRDAAEHRRLVWVDGSYQWQWNEGATLERVLWPLAQSAADLLTAPDLQKVRECDAKDCYWLLLDHSRNRSRRWCSMEACGNREKARRHYRRSRAR